MASPGYLDRLRAAVRRRGVGGLLRETGSRLGRLAYLHEEHVWYEMQIDGELPLIPIPEGCELVRARTDRELELAAQTGKDSTEARKLIARGHELWLAHDGETGLFTCWIFLTGAPTLAARGGWFELPEGVACIEESVTNPAYRGKSVGPAAVTEIVRTVRDEGNSTLVTKVAVDNAPSHRAVEKLGMKKTALCELTRIGPFRRVDVRDVAGRSGPLLAAALQ